MELTTAAAVMVLAAVLAVTTGCLILALRPLVDAVERVGDKLTALEAVANDARERVDARLYRVAENLAAHTAAVRETAAAAPEAVVAERDKLSEDYQRLAAATAVSLQYTPDPAVGTYQAGATEAIEHVRRHVQAAL